MSRCRKLRYRNELDAKIALASAQLKGLRNHRRQESRVYRCPHCRGWHLTSQDKRSSR